MRKTENAKKVGRALLARPDDQHFGWALSKRARTRTSTMYGVLSRMLEAGWLTDGWEDQAVAAQEKRPPRRFYELTAQGKAELTAWLAE